MCVSGAREFLIERGHQEAKVLKQEGQGTHVSDLMGFGCIPNNTEGFRDRGVT